jgi:hypothetical protein
MTRTITTKAKTARRELRRRIRSIVDSVCVDDVETQRIQQGGNRCLRCNGSGWYYWGVDRAGQCFRCGGSGQVASRKGCTDPEAARLAAALDAHRAAQKALRALGPAADELGMGRTLRRELEHIEGGCREASQRLKAAALRGEGSDD